MGIPYLLAHAHVGSKVHAMPEMPLNEVARLLAAYERMEADGEPIPMATYQRLRRIWFNRVGQTSLLSPAWKSHVPEGRGERWADTMKKRK